MVKEIKQMGTARAIFTCSGTKNVVDPALNRTPAYFVKFIYVTGRTT